VRWSSPSSGTYAVSGRFEGIDTGGTTTDVLITKNGTTLFTGVLNGYGNQLPFSLPVTVTAGDILEFSVGYGANSSYNGDSTGLAVTITGSGAGGGSSQAVHWLVTDHLGTPRMLIDQTGTLATIKRHDYLPFGEELFAPAGGRSAANRYGCPPGQQGCVGDGVRQQFTQKERDVETGLDYFLARYYSSVQGRFTSPDEFKGGAYEFWLLGDPSAGEKQALPFGDIRFPQSLNKFQYCFNNPFKFIDPSGHDALYVENKDTGKTTIVIPVNFTGPSVSQGLISEVISRASQLDTGNSNVTIQVVATDKPMHGVLNTMNLSPDLDPKYPKGEGVEGRGGKKGHIRINGVGGEGKIVHDTLHFAGLKDRYKEGWTLGQKRKAAEPSKGYDNSNIMSSNGGTTLKAEQIEEAKNNKSTKKCTTEKGVTTCN
jgi:RHS repeat-associated protein